MNGSDVVAVLFASLFFAGCAVLTWRPGRGRLVTVHAVAVVALVAGCSGELGSPPDGAAATTDQALTCVLDIDAHPTRAEVVAVLGEPVDVDQDAAEADPITGGEWLPATERLTWADGDTITFEDDRAQSWAIDDPLVC